MNVLSLFDGMACGLVALKRAGIKVDNYYASEIDKYAIQIAKKNHPEIQHLGNIEDYESWDLPKIDLIIGGSPCQGFSFAGKQLNFDDPRSALFFKFVECMWKQKEQNKSVKFLLENVKMKKESKKVITELMEVEPIDIDSELLSAQNRKRSYWFNWKSDQLKDKNILLNEIIDNDLEFNREPYIEKYISNIATNIKSRKFPTIRANAGSKTRGIGICDDLGWWRKLTPIECERLQTLPDNYTEGVSDTQRYKMIGNGWTVDVIVHILKSMRGEG